MIDQVFVVGTGRCGSTLISNILRLHPRIASISEFFSFITDLGCQVSTAFPSHEVDGVWLWRLISTAWPRQNLMIRHDVAMDEVLYPFQGGGAHRFDRNSGVPAISQVTLPHLSGEPDALLDELEPLVCALPNGTPGTLFAQLFELLAAYFPVAFRERPAWDLASPALPSARDASDEATGGRGTRRSRASPIRRSGS